MEKEQTKKRQRYLGLAAAVLLVTAVGPAVLAGGGGGKTPTVVAERTNGQEGENGSGTPPGPDLGTAADREGGSAEKSADAGGDSLNGLAQMVQAPDRYETSVQGEQVTLTADASVEIPDAPGMSARKVTAQVFTQEEYEKMMERFAGLLDLEWMEGLKKKFPESGPYYKEDIADGPDGEYEMWYVSTDGDKSEPPKLTKTYMELRKRSYYGTFMGTERFPDTFREELRTGKELKGLEAEADKVLKESGCSDWQLALSRWILGSQAYSQDSDTVKEEMEPMAQFFYTRRISGAPVLYAEETPLYGQNNRIGEYIEITLTRNKKLMRVYFCGKEEVAEGSKEPQFLLPFSEICQVFEQVMKTKGNRIGSVYDASETAGRMEQSVELGVTSVRLGYKSVYEKEGESFKEEGRMVPAWSFYGTVKIAGKDDGDVSVSQTVDLPGTVLLTVNAEDGTVIGE